MLVHAKECHFGVKGLIMSYTLSQGNPLYSDVHSNLRQTILYAYVHVCLWEAYKEEGTVAMVHVWVSGTNKGIYVHGIYTM